jgi:hypothetical protein
MTTQRSTLGGGREVQKANNAIALARTAVYDELLGLEPEPAPIPLRQIRSR